MMEERDLWITLTEAYHALGGHYVPVMDQKALDLGLPDGGGWLLLPALSFDPDPISAEKLRIRAPYTSPQWFNQGLIMLAEKGFLAPAPNIEKGYYLTQSGREVIEAVILAAYQVMEGLQPLSMTELENLANRLYQFVDACLDAQEPPSKWSITNSRKLDPGDKAHIMVRIDQYMSDLAAFRDDAHLASWGSFGIEGHAWEALTLIWRKEAATLDDLHQKLARRGYSKDDYREALDELTQREWITLDEGGYSLTPLGQEVRQGAEERTDRYFYQPWSCLSSQEIESLRKQLNNFKACLEKG